MLLLIKQAGVREISVFPKWTINEISFLVYYYIISVIRGTHISDRHVKPHELPRLTNEPAGIRLVQIKI